MSAHEKEATGDVEADANEGNEENTVRFFPDIVKERVKASLEPLNARSSALTEMMDRLIESNSARGTTTASTQVPVRIALPGAMGTYRSPTVAPFTTSDVHPTENDLNLKDFDVLVNFLEASCRE